MNKKSLLELKEKIKNKKPKFYKTDVHKKKRLSKRWRKPKGLHNKIRLGKRGYRKKVKKGYKSPKEVISLNKNGFFPVTVLNLQELNKIDKKTEGAVVSSKIGNKKRLQIIKQANKLDIKILNFSADKKLKEINEEFERRKLQKEEKEEEKKTKKKEEEKEKKKTIEEKVKKEELSDKEKKKLEKKEKDKALIKKQ